MNEDDIIGQSQANPTRDTEHLKLLFIFNIVMGILIILFSSLFIFYLYFMNKLFTDPRFYSFYPNYENTPVINETMRSLITLMIGGIIVIGWLTGIATILSGVFIKRRKYRMFSIVVAGINCFHVPFGTMLGVFTMVVLFRDSVISIYRQQIQ